MVDEADPGAWRRLLTTEEAAEASAAAGALFRRRFGHDVPGYPRHFELVYAPPGAQAPGARQVVAYVHQSPYRGVHLTGGMCVEEGAYRRFPRWLFAQVRAQGGLATVVTRDSLALLGDSPAAFGHVGEPRARQADLRTGYVDCGPPHLMVYWRRSLPEAEKARLVEMVAAHGPFERPRAAPACPRSGRRGAPVRGGRRGRWRAPRRARGARGRAARRSRA